MSKYFYCKNKRTVNSTKVPKTEDDLIDYVVDKDGVDEKFIKSVIVNDGNIELKEISFSRLTTNGMGGLMYFIYKNGFADESSCCFKKSDLRTPERELISRWTKQGYDNGAVIERSGCSGAIKDFKEKYGVQYKLTCDYIHTPITVNNGTITNNYGYILETVDGSPLIPIKYLNNVREINYGSYIGKHSKDSYMRKEWIKFKGPEYFYNRFIELTGLLNSNIEMLKSAMEFSVINDLRIEHGYFTRVVVEKEIVEKEVKVPEPILKSDYKIQNGMDKTISALKDLYMKYYGITLSRPRNQFESNIDSMYRILGLDISNEDDVYVAVVDILPRMFENYEKLGYSSTQFPKLCIGSLAVAWVVTGLNEGFPPKY